MKITINIYADNVTINNIASQDNFCGPQNNDNMPDRGDDYRAGYNEGYSDALFDTEANMDDLPRDPVDHTDDMVPGYGEIPPKPASMMEGATATPNADHVLAMDAAIFKLLFGDLNQVHVDEHGNKYRVSGGGVSIH